VPDPEHQDLFFLDNKDDPIVAHTELAKTRKRSFQGWATIGAARQFLLNLVKNPTRLRFGERSHVFLDALLVRDSIDDTNLSEAARSSFGGECLRRDLDSHRFLTGR
jgi:hypothetical protein